MGGLVFTIGHGARPLGELVAGLLDAEVATLVDVRRFPGSRRHPHFGREPLAAALAAAGIVYRHEVDLGGRRSSSVADERFACLEVAAFRSYATWMQTAEWQAALERTLAAERPALMCAETLWWRCHRRLIADLLVARGVEVRHLGRRGEAERHRLFDVAEVRDGHLYVCGERVA